MREIRRITIYSDAAGEWRIKAQAWNWRTVYASEEGFEKFTHAKSRAVQAFPGGAYEIVVLDGAYEVFRGFGWAEFRAKKFRW